MSNLKIFDKLTYDDLIRSVEHNKYKYLENKPFVFDKYNMNSFDYIPEISLIKPSIQEDYELENSIKLYEFLKDLDMSLIIDRRFWASLSHTYFFDYIHERMPAPKRSKDEKLENYNVRLEKHILNHYFQKGHHYRNRHALSGLWWRAHLTYDQDLNDPYEYTKKLYSLSDRDFLNATIENTMYLKHPDLLKAIIDIIINFDYSELKITKRKFNRDLTALINLESSTKLNSIYSYNYFLELVSDLLNETI